MLIEEVVDTELVKVLDHVKLVLLHVEVHEKLTLTQNSQDTKDIHFKHQAFFAFVKDAIGWCCFPGGTTLTEFAAKLSFVSVVKASASLHIINKHIVRSLKFVVFFA